MSNTRTTRRVVLSAAALAAVVLPGSVASADVSSPETATAATRIHHDVGAYDGHFGGKRVQFDGHIVNNSLAVSPDNKIAAASNSESGRVVVINLHNGRKIKELKGYTNPRNILFAPDGKSFTITDSTLGVLDRISVPGYQVVKRLPLGAGVFGTAQTKDGKRLYANNEAASTVTAVDLAENRPVDVITGFSEPRQGVKLAPAEDRLYVTNFTGSKIIIVNTKDIRDPKASFPNVPKDPNAPEPAPKDPKDPLAIEGFKDVRGVSISADGKWLYAANSGDDSVSIVNVEGTNRNEVHRVKLEKGDAPYGAALSPDGKTLFSGNKGSNTLTVINPGTGEKLGTVLGTETDPLKEPRQAISFSHDSTIAWVLNKDLTIAKVDVQKRKVIGTLGR